MPNKTIPDDLMELINEIEASYWVPMMKTPFSTLQELEEKSKEDCPALYECFSAFNSNLSAARDLLEFPYLLIAPLLPEVKDAMTKMRQAHNDTDTDTFWSRNRTETIELVTSSLKGSKKHFHGVPELQRLMHQSCLLIWGALDTYCKAVFIASLNKNPSLLGQIYNSPKLKDIFKMSDNWQKLLESHDYNLHGKLGTIVAANKDFSSPQLICDLFPIMFANLKGPSFPSPIFNTAGLQKLGQRRHLIAHRCGIVDQEYLDKSRDTTQAVGKLLQLRGRDVAESLGAAASFAILVYGNARSCWKVDSASIT